MRKYALGACLLDQNDPSKLLARMSGPLIRPDATERKGYVPNVVYSCGALLHDRTLVLPFAVADSFTTFATMPIDRLLAAMAWPACAQSLGSGPVKSLAEAAIG